MNLTKQKKKKGFTLIELMAVIAIVAILAAVLVPTVSGYINRAKKTAIITQIRTVVNAVESYDSTAANPIGRTSSVKISELTGDTTTNTSAAVVGFRNQALLSTNDISKLHLDITYADVYNMNNESDLINLLTVSGSTISYKSKQVSR